MSFQQEHFLPALLLALLPVIIHLIHQNRHRTVKWAAMMFLVHAKQMTRGMARLRQILILALRVLALAALIFAASRPLASGWLALTAGGDSGAILVLLDRSSSMEQQNLETGISKRSSALVKISELLEKTARGRRTVLIDSASLTPIELARPSDLIDLPASGATDTAADIPALIQAALDYVSFNQSGRTDIWLASDLRESDWQQASGRWESLRAGFTELPGVHFFLLNYPETEIENFAVSVANVERRRSANGFELVMDLTISSQIPQENPFTLPVELTVNGARTAWDATIQGSELVMHGYRVDLGRSESAGWGRIDLPADGNLRDNTCFFVFDELPPLSTVVVTDDDVTARAIRAAASTSVETQRPASCEVLPVSRASTIAWEKTALLFWQAPLPAPNSPTASLLEQFVASGKSLILLPPQAINPAEQDQSFLGIRWIGEEVAAPKEEGFEIGWWRTDSGLLRNTRSGSPLPLGSTRIKKFRNFEGDFQPLLKLGDNQTLVARHTNSLTGNVFLWATLPNPDYSTLASDGVAFYIMIQRALQEGGRYLATAQNRFCGKGAIPDQQVWTAADGRKNESLGSERELLAGVYKSSNQWIALNRPASEDDLRLMNEDALEKLFAGLHYRVIRETVDNRSSLAAEIWKAFLYAMALALIAEAVLCLPPRPEASSGREAFIATA